MKFVSLLAILLSLTAHGASTELNGKSHTGEPCSITIESWEFTGAEPSWNNVKVTFRTNWLKAGNPSLVAGVSETPYTLLAANAETRDHAALFFQNGSDPTVDALNYFLFQSWDAERGSIQARCVIRR